MVGQSTHSTGKAVHASFTLPGWAELWNEYISMYSKDLLYTQTQLVSLAAPKAAKGGI